jgi:hypothetical protein
MPVFDALPLKQNYLSFPFPWVREGMLIEISKSSEKCMKIMALMEFAIARNVGWCFQSKRPKSTVYFSESRGAQPGF